MTLVRVKLEDEAKIVKKLKKEEPAIAKYFAAHNKDWDVLLNVHAEWLAKSWDAEEKCKKILADARKGYSMADKKLKELNKDKKANKEQITEMLKMRKYFYTTGVAAKDWSKNISPY